MNALDHALFLSLNLGPGAPPWLIEATLAFSASLLYVAGAAALVVALAATPPQRRAAQRVLLAMVLGTLAVELLKRGFNRPRPMALGLGQQWLAHEAGHSFPSAHATLAMACALAAAMAPLPGGTRALLMGLALAEGWSRIAVGVHFPTDVLAGWCLGALCAWAAWRLPVPDDARLRQWLARWR